MLRLGGGGGEGTMRALSQGGQALGSGAPGVSACAEGRLEVTYLKLWSPISHQLNQ